MDVSQCNNWPCFLRQRVCKIAAGRIRSSGTAQQPSIDRVFSRWSRAEQSQEAEATGTNLTPSDNQRIEFKFSVTRSELYRSNNTLLLTKGNTHLTVHSVFYGWNGLYGQIFIALCCFSSAEMDVYWYLRRVTFSCQFGCSEVISKSNKVMLVWKVLLGCLNAWIPKRRECIFQWLWLVPSSEISPCMIAIELLDFFVDLNSTCTAWLKILRSVSQEVWNKASVIL